MAAHEFVVEGEPGFRLAISVSGYEFPREVRGSDAEWLIATVELRLDGRVAGRIESNPCLRGIELECFGDELDALLAGTVDAAELVTLEDMVELQLKRSSSGVLVSGIVTNHGDLEVEFDGATVALAALGRTREQLGELLRAFPVKPQEEERRSGRRRWPGWRLRPHGLRDRGRPLG